MQEKHLFEYAVIRFVPKVEREEFINIGVILFCAELDFLRCKFSVNDDKLRSFAVDADFDEIRRSLNSFQRICAGEPGSGAIGSLPAAERFRWLTATRSTIIQTSVVHPGYCDDAEKTLEKVWGEMVG